jgi:hypothetical protein
MRLRESLPEDGASSGGDHGGGPSQEAAQGLALQVAELADLEELSHSAARFALDLVVSVEEGQPKTPRQERSDGRLPGAARADQDDPLFIRGCHQ